MTTSNRSFTYRRRIKVSTSDLALAKERRKVCTIRVGTLGVDGTTIDLTDGQESAKVKITSVETDKTVNDLTDDHAKREGFSTKEELLTDLRKYYRKLDPGQPITIINFELL